MTTIKQLLAMPIGEKVGGFELSIKTFKKNFQVGNIWFQQVILMDTTGEMPADINRGKAYSPVRGHGNKIRIVVCEVQEAEYLGKDRKKLLVHEHTIPTTTMAEYEEEQEAIEAKWNKETEGKIRHGLVCSFIKAGKEINKPMIETLVKYIMTGE
jgi:hypothetical protein